MRSLGAHRTVLTLIMYIHAFVGGGFRCCCCCFVRLLPTDINLLLTLSLHVTDRSVELAALSSLTADEIILSNSMPPTTHTDRGWAWVVLAATMGSTFLNGALLYFVGVVHAGLLRKFNESVSLTAWVGGLYSSLIVLAGESLSASAA